jgi:hypothetical protein
MHRIETMINTILNQELLHNNFLIILGNFVVLKGWREWNKIP